MKSYPFVEGTRREFIRDKRKSLKVAKKAVQELRYGCAMRKMFDGTFAFRDAVHRMDSAIETMDKITKPLA